MIDDKTDGDSNRDLTSTEKETRGKVTRHDGKASHENDLYDKDRMLVYNRFLILFTVDITLFIIGILIRLTNKK